MKTFVAIIIALFATVACNSLNVNEVTVYQVDCVTKRPLNRVTYKASFEHQLVIEMLEGNTPIRLTDCIVKDKRNWSCDAGATRMTEGRFQAKWLQGIACYESWWRWWAYHWFYKKS